MTAAPRPFDHEVKLQRARQHFDEMKVEVAKWLRGNYYTVRYELEPDGMTLIRATAEQPPPYPFSVFIGDCLHNMRSALDLLAYALAVKYSLPLPLPDDVAKDSEFPIFGDEDRKGRPSMGPAMFKSGGFVKIRGMDPKAQAIIEGLQPYHRGNDFRSDPLWTLQILDNISKHRLLHGAIGTSSGVTLDTYKSFNVRVEGPRIESYGGPITTDTPVGRFKLVPPDPSLPMNVQIQPTIDDIAFVDAPPGIPDKSVIKTLADIYNYLVGKVVPPLNGFL